MAHRVLQVGAGGFGGRWLEVLRETARALDLDLCGLADMNAEALLKRGDEFKVPEAKRFLSLDEALSETAPEIVLCVTPPETHEEVALAALEAGAHVITEKPISSHMDGARRMVEAAERAGRLLAVSQNYRFRPAACAVAETIRSERLGPCASFTLEFFLGPRFEGSFRRHMPYPLTADMSIHHYDLMRAILGRDPLWTFARAFNPPWSWYEHEASVQQLIGFEGDLTGAYSASWCSRGAETPWSGAWRFECAEGVLLWDAGGVRIGTEAETLEEVPPPEMEFTGQGAVLADFVRSLREGREPATSGRDNLKSVGMVFKTIEAVETGQMTRF